jgi:hypothetical protein
MRAYDFDYVKKEVKEICQQVPGISSDNAFVVWFLRAFFTDDQEIAINSLCGGSKDKGLDAVYIDHEARTVFIVQGKYRQGRIPKSEARSDLISFADYAHILSGPVSEYKAILDSAASNLQGFLEKARKAVIQNGFRVSLLFVTSGKVSKSHTKELEEKTSPPAR